MIFEAGNDQILILRFIFHRLYTFQKFPSFLFYTKYIKFLYVYIYLQCSVTLRLIIGSF